MAEGNRGNAETLRRYWAEGEGAAKIRWGEPGDFDRCVREVEEYMPGRAKGYCNLLHKRALGYYPATHAKMMGASHDCNDLVGNAVALGIADSGMPDRLALGIWDELLHPRVPKGSPGGGKFAPKAGGSGKGAAKGKGAKGKGGKGKGGAKGAAAAKKAQQAAQTKAVLASLQKMPPDQRAAALAKLTDPQLKALHALANQGNSEDPNVKAMRTAIADELAKRSLTGAKGPTQVNAAKRAAAQAAASKHAATAQAAAQRKAAAAARQKAAATARAQRQQATAARQQATAQRRAQLLNLRQQLATTTDKTRQAALRQMIRRVAVGLPAVPPATPAPVVAASHTGGGLALAVPANCSQDGPAVTMNAGQRIAYAKSGVAMKDGSFPIPDRNHLRKAVKAIGRAHPSKRSAVKAHIRKRAKALGVPLPDAVK